MSSKIIAQSHTSYSIVVAPIYTEAFQNLENRDRNKIVEILKKINRGDLASKSHQNPDFTYHDLRKLSAFHNLEPRCILINLHGSWCRVDFLVDDIKSTLKIQGIIFNIKPKIKKRNLRKISKKFSASCFLFFFLRLYLYLKQ